MQERLRGWLPSEIDLVPGLQRQFRAMRSLLALIYVPIVIALVIVLVTRIRTGIPIADFTVDPLIVVGGAPVYTGILSTMGGLVWASTVAISLFTWTAVRASRDARIDARFLLTGACITGMLMLDDVFLFHEIVFPRYLGIPQQLLYAVYGLIVAGFVVFYRRTILSTDHLLLILALVGFGVSILSDITVSVNPLPGEFLIEDGAKIFGLVSWSAYFIRVSRRYLTFQTAR